MEVVEYKDPVGLTIFGLIFIAMGLIALYFNSRSEKKRQAQTELPLTPLKALFRYRIPIVLTTIGLSLLCIAFGIFEPLAVVLFLLILLLSFIV